MTIAIAEMPAHSGSFELVVGGIPFRSSWRVTHGVSSQSPRMKKTSTRAAIGHQSKPMSWIDQSAVTKSTAAKTCSATWRRAISKMPVATVAQPTMT